MNFLTPLTTLDILFVVCSIVIAGTGFYIIIILHRVSHMTKVADRFANTVEKFQDAFAIFDKIPTDMIRRAKDALSRKK